MNILVTGAGGFIGQALASSLLNDPQVSDLTLTDVFEPSLPSSSTSHKVKCIKADLTSLKTCESLFTDKLTVTYLLHGLMSGAAEANLELGLKVNIDSVRQILDILRRVNPGVKVVYPSSIAVYGPPEGNNKVVTEQTTPLPGSSYGAQKLICETLLNDYSRLGLLDGRILRLPTVVVRPGVPSGAASSFASGIFREPLKGEKSVLPVSKELEMWICSPRTVVKNLVLARDIPKEKFPARTRVVNLPGLTVTVRQMLEALQKVGGEKALMLVEEKRDKAIEKIVETWSTRFDTSRAKMLGFEDDGTFEDTLQAYIEDYGKKT
ncbi:MAG: hypothetical protein FRX48_08770 [Lasallia pustulata]|uniref:NAD-dependent epimerase/dehydratase domain-containing protein n=1 Tax=Lasallia pustulata TaxID=136370 RepID=A0A5M8PDW2_9LECA|nr:MAG: hypothetical protein FRX48_08770 [Lasallia pustulata]